MTEKICWIIFCIICGGVSYFIGVTSEKVKLLILLKNLYKYNNVAKNKQYLTAIADVMIGSGVDESGVDELPKRKNK